MEKTLVRAKNNLNRLTVGKTLILIVLTFLGIITFYPFWYILCVATSTIQGLGTRNLILIPHGFTLENLASIFINGDFMMFYKNTMFVVVIGTLMSLTTTICFAYSLSRKVRGYRFLQFFLFFTLIFSGGMIPTYLVVKATGLVNTLWALMLPRLMDPFNVFLLRNFFASIPVELEESASIEGAGTFKIMFRIIFPLSKAGIATIAMFYAVFFWNQYFDAILYLGVRKSWTVQVMLREVLSNSQPDFFGGSVIGAGLPSRMAIVAASILPIIVFYPLIQKHMVKGVMVGAVKG